MTALEEMKKGKHPDRIWATVNGMSTRLPDGARQLVGGWSQDAERAGSAEYVLASTLESLQRENAELRKKADYRENELVTMLNSADESRVGQIRRAEAAEAEVKRLQAEIDRKSSMPGDHRYWEGRYREEAADNELLRSVLRPMADVAGDISESWPDDAQVVTEIGHFRRARTALASTGGEHHAE